MPEAFLVIDNENPLRNHISLLIRIDVLSKIISPSPLGGEGQGEG